VNLTLPGLLDAPLGDEIVVALASAGAVAAFGASAVVCIVPLVG
jgi:hypothetical protein